MIRHLINLAVFTAGMAAVGWIGALYAGSNLLALAVIGAVATVYVAGAAELWRFDRATTRLARALDGLAAPRDGGTSAVAEAPDGLQAWLAPLPAPLRDSVRLRVQGLRVALPGPTLAPYFAGLLVLLGMLGTFLGMVATLRGTGGALESATDLQAMRASLAAPVKGLAFAFGTSVAGVATSAMLGLLTALCRRERLRVTQRLDTAIATTLRPHTQLQQRESMLQLMQRQADAVPALVDRLDAMTSAMTRQNEALNERMVASQASFHATAEASHAHLVASLTHALQQNAAASAEATAAAIQPAVETTLNALTRQAATLPPLVEATLAGLKREAAAIPVAVETALAGMAAESATLHRTVTASLQEYLDAMTGRIGAGADAVAATWQQALAEHRATTESVALSLRETLDGSAHTFEQRCTSLIDNLSQRLDNAAGAMTQGWQQTLARHEAISGAASQASREAFAQAAAGFDRNAAALVRHADQSQTALLQTLAAAQTDLLQALRESQAALLADIGQSQGALIHAVDTRHGQLLERGAAAQAEMLTRSEQARAALMQNIADAHTALVQHVATAHATLQQQAADQDTQRLSAWTETLTAMTQTLTQEWREVGVQTAQRQREICAQLEASVGDISAQTKAHASNTIAEIGQLLQAAGEAPRAAADAVAQLRRNLSESMARDNAMLEERSRLLETVGTLLDAVNHASTQQRTAVDELVNTSASLLERVGSRFTESTEQAGAQVTAQLEQVAAQIAARLDDAGTRIATTLDQAGGQIAATLEETSTRFTGHAQAESQRLAAAAQDTASSVVEIASLGDALGTAVHTFGESNAQLIQQLQRVSEALDKSMTRSDEQLAYYVAQAREVIDLSLMSQKQIIGDLQRIADAATPRADGTDTAGTDTAGVDTAVAAPADTGAEAR